MKIPVTKILAAKSQLTTAINLFFEQKDPISIHTLTSASLQILNDHFSDKGTVWDNNLMFHYDSIYIKDEYKKEWMDKIKEPANFFKHADRDLKNGKNTIEFNIQITDFHIFEAIRCLKIIEGSNFQFLPEFQVYFSWFMLKNPSLVKDKAKKLLLAFDSPPRL